MNVVYAAAMFFLYLFAASPINDLIDKFGDKAAKRRTIPIVIGDKNTFRLSIIASMIPFISSVALTSSHHADILMPIILAFVSLRSVQLLIPLLRICDRDTLKKAHGQMIAFHFILQAAILIGFIRFL